MTSPSRSGVRAAIAALLGASLVACGGGGDSGLPTQPAGPTTPGTPSTPTTSPTDTMPLRRVIETRGVRIAVGTALGALFNSTDPASAQYTAVAAREFNVLTPENEMKPNALQPIRGVFCYGRADSMVAFARANSMRVRGHVLAWHSQNPSWLTGGAWTAAEASTLLDDHIRNVVGHYRGQLAAWDVVNEAFTDGTPTLRPGVWADRIGRGYVEQAFRSARAADPDVPLFYNDYNIEGLGAKSDSVYALLSDLRARGVPVTGVGMQMHLIAGQLPTTMAANFARFAALGLRIHVTELDVRVPTPSTAASLQTQAQNYRDVFALCLQTPACDMVVVWGFTDRASWIPSTFAGQGDALLFDASFGKKPAYTAVHALLAGG